MSGLVLLARYVSMPMAEQYDHVSVDFELCLYGCKGRLTAGVLCCLESSFSPRRSMMELIKAG
eukprot:12562491-Ditylum_brightwellii.AAC.1